MTTPAPRGKRRTIVAHGSAWLLRQVPGGPLVLLRPGSEYDGRELPATVHVMSPEEELKAAIETLVWPNGKPVAKVKDFEMQD
jgi:hypothetical protein